MDKAPDAFRTISEVAEAIAIPAHVLRFWETRFPQIKPVKRTQGVRHVAAIGGASPADLDRAAAQALEPVRPSPPQAQVLTLDAPARGPHPPTSDAAAPEAATMSDQRQSATIRALFASDPANANPAPPNLPLDPAPTPTRKPRTANLRPVLAVPDQPALPLFAQVEAPEAPHIWVEADTPPDAAVIPFLGTQPTPASPTPASTALAQMAAQLQPLPAPAAGQSDPALRALHAQLSQLHARMAQALRQQS